MSDAKVLSNEEVDAILKVTQEKNRDLSDLMGNTEVNSDWLQGDHNLTNLLEMTRMECQKTLSTFLRKKVIIKSKSVKLIRVLDSAQPKPEAYLYALFHTKPIDHFGIVALDTTFLHQ